MRPLPPSALSTRLASPAGREFCKGSTDTGQFTVRIMLIYRQDCSLCCHHTCFPRQNGQKCVGGRGSAGGAYSAFADPLPGPRGLRKEEGTRKRGEGKCKEEGKDGKREREVNGTGGVSRISSQIRRYLFPLMPSFFPRSLPKNQMENSAEVSQSRTFATNC